MKQLWSPWRMEYIMEHTPSKECIFCAALTGGDDAASLLLYRGERAFIILNLFPYTSGHLMVVPNAHVPFLDELDSETRLELIELTCRAEYALRTVYRPEGFNIGANIGAAAGAGIVGHLHFHVVPRWQGDTSFMSTVSGVRVLPEELSDTYQRLKGALGE